MPTPDALALNFKKSGSGDPLIIMHGLFGSLDNWVTLAKNYAENFTVYLVDARNHGHSPHSNDCSYSAMAADIKFLIEQEGLTQGHIMGHSMGGKTAMFFAGLYPSLVRSLTVADIGPRYYPVHHTSIIKALQSIDLSSATSRSEVDNQLSKLILDDGVRQFLLKGLYRLPEGSEHNYAWRYNLESISRGIEEVGIALPVKIAFEGPTLFIKGANSEYIMDGDKESILLQFPNAQFTTIPKAGHWLHAENPEAYLDETLAFLLRH